MTISLEHARYFSIIQSHTVHTKLQQSQMPALSSASAYTWQPGVFQALYSAKGGCFRLVVQCQITQSHPEEKQQQKSLQKLSVSYYPETNRPTGQHLRIQPFLPPKDAFQSPQPAPLHVGSLFFWYRSKAVDTSAIFHIRPLRVLPVRTAVSFERLPHLPYLTVAVPVAGNLCSPACTLRLTSRYNIDILVDLYFLCVTQYQATGEY